MQVLVGQNLLSGLEAVHYWHHQVHYDQFVVFFGACFVTALEIEPLFKFFHRFFPVSGLFREDGIVHDAQAAMTVQAVVILR